MSLGDETARDVDDRTGTAELGSSAVDKLVGFAGGAELEGCV
jgi:hypothetical protein